MYPHGRPQQSQPLGVPQEGSVGRASLMGEYTELESAFLLHSVACCCHLLSIDTLLSPQVVTFARREGTRAFVRQFV